MDGRLLWKEKGVEQGSLLIANKVRPAGLDPVITNQGRASQPLDYKAIRQCRVVSALFKPFL